MLRHRMMYNQARPGFTLVELLTVISIIAVLTGILLPVFNSVRRAAHAVVCQANARTVGFAYATYSESYDGYLPPAYTYVGGRGLLHQYTEPVDGILHWSGMLMAAGYATEDAFVCPGIARGGLAPRNTDDSNLDPGQESERVGVVDVQARRCAFTVNEVLSPRNRFKVGAEDAAKPSRLVRTASVSRPDCTIALTEWATDWRVVADPDTNLSNSYLPVHGFRGLGQVVGPDRYDLNMMVSDVARPCMSSAAFRRVTVYDLADNPTGARHYPPRLDWVGRNHPGSGDRASSTFWYLDGHIESKSIYETVSESGFEWGQRIYSLTGRNSIK